MKKGYKKLLFFELVLFSILILNSFVWNILSEYIMIAFLLITIIALKLFFGIEKDKHRYTKDIILEIIIFLIIFFILFYLLGIIISFARTNNYYTITALKKFIIPIILYITLREFLRYAILCKAQGSRLLIITTALLFIIFDITNTLYFSNFTNNYKILTFIGLTLLPAISNNIAFTYITLKTGYKPIIFYALIINLYQYLLPIIPNPDAYLASIIYFILPMILTYRINKFFQKEHERDVTRDYHKRNFISLILSSVFVIILVYFSSGYFHYWTVAIATGSMSPIIKKGDVAIVEKIDNKSNLKVGEVIAFKYHNVIIVHRIVNIVKDREEYYFYTKGDANANQDNFTLKSNMIIGVVNHKIPYIGRPTVWLNELSK